MFYLFSSCHQKSLIKHLHDSWRVRLKVFSKERVRDWLTMSQTFIENTHQGARTLLFLWCKYGPSDILFVFWIAKFDKARSFCCIVTVFCLVLCSSVDWFCVVCCKIDLLAKNYKGRSGFQIAVWGWKNDIANLIKSKMPSIAVQWKCRNWDEITTKSLS